MKRLAESPDPSSFDARKFFESLIDSPSPKVSGPLDRDKTRQSDDTLRMNDISREELDAKLEATQAKIDARLAGFESTVRETLSAVRQDSADMRGELKLIHAQLGDLQHVKRSIWGAAAATVLGVSGIIATIIGLGVASFDSGRETSQLVESAKQQTQATQKLLEQMQSQKQAPSSPAAPPSRPE
ncbi:hypothetical protein [Pseudomonas putida]|uniref:hypothetical protein n=1 Tax=Pseudomonas putida TaxID=303 RepID=UPI0012DA5A94|nr:hypothetical protein [Pseudomonas putida]